MDELIKQLIEHVDSDKKYWRQIYFVDDASITRLRQCDVIDMNISWVLSS